MVQRAILKSFLLWVLAVGFLNPAYAGNTDSVQLTPYGFKDQWDKPNPLDASVKWLIFSHHKAGNEWVKDALNELDIQNLKAMHWLYVADISGMPSFVTKLFALPKMRKYAFPIALSDDEINTQDWPEQEDTVSVYKLDHLKIVEYKTFPDKASLEDFLMSI